MKKIAVVGSVNMDLTVKAQRHPNKGETVSGSDLQYIPGGKGANQAVAAARLGGDVTMFGCVGDDIFGDQLLKNLEENGVKTEHMLRIPHMSSGIALITVAESDNTIVVVPGANHNVTPDYLQKMKDKIMQADIILLQNEIPLKSVELIVHLAAQAGKTVIYNPAPAVPVKREIIDKVTFLTPNEHETALLFPEENDLNTLLEKQNGSLIVTLGEKGVAAFYDGRVIQIPARNSDVIDTTGAGDTFNGAFAYALANDYPVDRALRFANIAAGLSAEHMGAQSGMPDYDTVEKELQ